MDSKHIHQLLDKYWDGQTSLDEEHHLRRYFSNDDIPDDLKAFQPLFRYFESEQQQALSADFDAMLLEKLKKENAGPSIRRRLYVHVARAAAVLLVFLIAFWWVSNRPAQNTDVQAINWSKYEEQDPQKALEEVQAALRLISRKMNKSADQAAEGVGQIQKATKIIK